MITFTSKHTGLDRRYRVTAPGDEHTVARVEFEHDRGWRDCPSDRTRWIAHTLVHGQPPSCCTEQRAVDRIQALADAAVRDGAQL
jgi:hypothetical protein